MTGAFVHTVGVMGTVVTIQIVGHDATADERRDREAAVARAAGWFEQVERECSRFDPDSSIRKLISRIGDRVPVSPLVFEAVRFALAVANESGGAFDPTIGLSMEEHGFDEEHRTGDRMPSAIDATVKATYHDVSLDETRRTITLARPLVLDLGAVAKGLAIDLAVRELEPFEHFAIDAGGDLYLGGSNAAGEPWAVGVRHPRDESQCIATLRVSNMAVCTSGDYEKTHNSGPDATHHLLDPRSGASAAGAASVTVVASSAMVADALGTAAFVLGPARGIELLERHGVEGFLITPALERFATRGMRTDFVRPTTLTATA